MISGKLYFVSDDDNLIVYERIYIDKEWEIGDEIGHAEIIIYGTKEELCIVKK